MADRAYRRAAGLGWPLSACIGGTALLRCASFATGILISLLLSRLERAGRPVSATEVGMLAVIFYTIELAGAPVFGRLTDRYGFRIFLLIGPITGAVAAQIMGFTYTVLALFIVRALEGLSSAASIPATLAFLSARTRDDAARRAQVMSLFEAATIVGVGAGGALAGLLSQTFHRGAFTAAALIYLVSLALFARIRPERNPCEPAADPDPAPVESSHGTLRTYLDLLIQPRILRFVPAWVAVNAILGLWISQGPFLLTRTDNPAQFLDGGFTDTQMSLVFSLVGGAFLVGILIWGYYLGHRPPITIMGVGLVGLYAMVAFLFALNHAVATSRASHALLITGVVLAIVVASAFTPAALTYLAIIAEENACMRGTIMGLYSVFFGVGQFLGSALGGPFVDLFSADGLILLTAILTVFATVCVQLLRTGERRRVALPEAGVSSAES